MKILLDENVPRDLKQFLSDHYVFTTQEMGWGALKNGELLTKAEPLFDVFITLDKNIQKQSNFTSRKICVVTLMSKFNKLGDLIPLIPNLRHELANLQPGSGTVLSIFPQ